ncbi:MAG: hypothetical protein CR971_01185 [candidate division SR1 bacterium]|nr:MAG: hypothetical protein CR971_01185 [candidate division SR1 bacterium]
MRQINIGNIKKWGIRIVLFFVVTTGLAISFSDAVGPPPSFDDNFVDHLYTSKGEDKEKSGDVYTMEGIQANKTLKQNIACLFYPNHTVAQKNGCGNSPGGILWDFARNIMVAIVFIFLVIIGARLLLSNPDSEKDKIREALNSLYYIGIGAVLFFGAVRILGTLLNFGGIQGTESVVNRLQGGGESLFYRVIAFLKILTFFIAIIMMVVYGFKIITAVDKADEAKKHLRGVFNVIIALILIKIVDYIYYIAQAKDFSVQAQGFILSFARILGLIIGAGAILMVFYAGFLLLTDQGKSENMKKAKNIFMNVVLIAIVIFMFLLIMYQIFAEFA